MKRTALLLMLVFACCALHAQVDSTQIIEISSLTRSPKGQLPFDQIFFLKIPKTKELSLEGFTVSKLSGKKKNRYKNFGDREQARIEETYGEGNYTYDETESTKMFSRFFVLHENSIGAYPNAKQYSKRKMNVVETDTYILVKVFPLDPNHRYSFDYSFMSKNEEIGKQIDKVIRQQDGASLSLNKALKRNFLTGDSLIDITTVVDFASVLNGKTEAQDTVTSIQALLRRNEVDSAMRLLLEFDENAVAPRVKKGLNAKANAVNLLLALTDNIGSTIELTRFLTCYPNLYAWSLQCDTCPDNMLLQNHLCLNACEMAIRTSAANKTGEILLGQLPINYTESSSALLLSKMAERKANLVMTATVLEKVSMMEQIAPGVVCSVQPLLTLVYNRIVDIDLYLNKKTALLKLIYGYKYDRVNIMNSYTAVSSLGYSTGASTMRTKGKFNVRPDFGVAYFTNFEYGNNVYHGVVPFFGLRFNMRPLDPDLPFRFIRFKNFWHRSSINVSYSPITISDGTTRFDIYKNMNFLVGYGYRCSNAINISAGAMFFKRKHPDALVTQHQLTAVPYFGVTIDFDVLDVAKDFINLFK